MKYDRFEDLPVWQSAMRLAEGVYALTRDKAFRQSGDLPDQLRRAALSVSNNIAEGFQRGTTSELVTFLYIARGSAGEVRSMLHFCERLLTLTPRADIKVEKVDPKGPNPESDISDLKSEISDLKSIAESCSRQVRAWADSLQNTDIKGQRHLNDRTRAAYDHARRADVFWSQIEEMARRSAERGFRAGGGAEPDAAPGPGSGESEI